MNFNIDNKVKFINGISVKNMIFDGDCLSVHLLYDDKSIKCEQYNLSSASSASPEIKKLMKLLHSLIKEKQEYKNK